jgi:hypothetical protein
MCTENITKKRKPRKSAREVTERLRYCKGRQMRAFLDTGRLGRALNEVILVFSGKFFEGFALGFGDEER